MMFVRVIARRMFVLINIRREPVVPARLTLRNFLCYREPPESGPTIDFTGIQIACLTGDNGNGKSALLDAMTWALWGQARARTDDELIHLGRTEMEVEFEFYGDEQLYRVIRKRKRGTNRSTGSTALEFHIWSGQAWRPLTANHVRETEGRILDVLKLDYETFINSAFLIQGRADAFTTKTPGDRKKILGEILGLSRYDELEKQARFERGLRDDQARAVTQELAHITQELAREPEYKEERKLLSESLESLIADLSSVSSTLEDLRQTERLAALQRAQLDQAGHRWNDARQEAERALQQSRRQQDEITRYAAIVRDGPVIEDGYARLLAARKEEDAYNDRLHQYTDLERVAGSLEAEIAQKRAEQNARVQLLEGDVQRLLASVEAGAHLSGMRNDLEARSLEVEGNAAQLGEFRRTVQRLRDSISGLNAENKQLRAEMDEIKRKQNDLNGVTVCPLCKTELGEDGRAHLVDAYESDGRRLVTLYREKRALIQRDETQVADLERQIAAYEPKLQRERNELSREHGKIDGIIRDAEEAEVRLPRRSEELAQTRSGLVNESFAVRASEDLNRLRKQQDGLAYDRSAHDSVRELAMHLRPFEASQRDLQLARSRLQVEQAALAETQRLLTDWQERANQGEAEVLALRATVEALPEVGGRLADLETKHAMLVQQQTQRQLALGGIEQRLKDCDRLRFEKAGKENALKKACEERGIYDELAAAFSRRGIQALIIDHVIPEITEEANRLLARMTNNRLRVMMDTQRQTQRGTVTETLDIRIADELGTRNYELFSGGEAFRVNLALRIALSKLLARRAGAPLPTLVIDEGFGSQDAAALERLVEAINVIQSDFQCLLVITHLNELKDQFPVQIVVSKNGEGASAAVIA
jgi:exonuclease SbcC